MISSKPSGSNTDRSNRAKSKSPTSDWNCWSHASRTSFCVNRHCLSAKSVARYFHHVAGAKSGPVSRPVVFRWKDAASSSVSRLANLARFSASSKTSIAFIRTHPFAIRWCTRLLYDGDFTILSTTQTRINLCYVTTRGCPMSHRRKAVQPQPEVASPGPTPAFLHDIPTAAKLMSTTCWAVRELCRSGRLKLSAWDIDG